MNFSHLQFAMGFGTGIFLKKYFILFFSPTSFETKKIWGFFFPSVNSTNLSKIFQCFAKIFNVFSFLEIFVTKKKWGNFCF